MNVGGVMSAKIVMFVNAERMLNAASRDWNVIRSVPAVGNTAEIDSPETLRALPLLNSHQDAATPTLSDDVAENETGVNCSLDPCGSPPSMETSGGVASRVTSDHECVYWFPAASFVSNSIVKVPGVANV